MTPLLVLPRTDVPSGGTAYDLRLRDALAALGRPVREAALPGDWPEADPGARAGLARVLADAPDGAAVLLDGIVACGVPEAVLPHAGRLRLVVLVHLPLADETGLARARAAELDARERTVLRAASAVVATSGWAARRLAERHGIGVVHVVEPGVDPAPLSPAGDGSRLLCVASVTPRKGHDVLLGALAALGDLSWTCACVGPGPPVAPEGGAIPDGPGAGRAAAGPGTHADLLRRLLRGPGLAGRVAFVGPLAGADLARAYARADLLVLPSRAETYGMVVTEALSRGTPVAATAVGGVPEALGRDAEGGRPGLLVPPGDPAALADALRRWLTGPGLRARLRRSARDRREGLAGWDAAARAMAAVLDGEGSR